jgi:hypothetical protein
MKRLLGFSLMALAIMATAAFARPVQNAKVAGSWDITVESPQGKRDSLLVIKQEGDKLSGAMKSPRGERPLDNVSVKGNEITFAITFNAQGQDIIITYKGKVEKGVMSGDADFGGLASGTWSAVPHKEGDTPAPSPSTPGGSPSSAMNISGVWNFAVETSAGSGSPVFTLKQEGDKVTGTYKGQLGEAAVTGTVSGSDVKLMYKVNAQGEELAVTYTGKITGKDSMSGKANYGTLGEGTWTAKKQ